MIKILTQKRIRNYEGKQSFFNKIKHSFDYIFDILGMRYQFATPDSINKKDIVIYYGLDEPSDEELRFLAQNNLVFFIISDPLILKFDKSLNADFVAEHTRNIKLSEEIPILTTLPLKNPIEKIESADVIAYKITFDIIGNIFFQVSNYYYFLAEKDRTKRIIDEKYSFYNYKDIPFVNVMIDQLEKMIIHGVGKKKICLTKKELWPKAQNFALAITHNVDKLNKWKNIFDQFGWLFHLVIMCFYNWKKLKERIDVFKRAIESNKDPYWNFMKIIGAQSAKIQATFFIGAREDKNLGFDYNIKDESILEELRQILAHGNEVAQFGSFISANREKLINEAREFDNIIKNKLRGIRQFGKRYIFDTTPLIHDKIGYSYDSSVAFSHSNGFRNGIGYPYNILDKNVIPDCLEFQINFSDNVIAHDKMNLEESIDYAKQIIKTVEKYNGFLTFEFNFSNFTEISFLKKFLINLSKYIQSKNAFVAPLKEVSEWLINRRYISITESEDIISIAFPKQTMDFVLTIYGNYKIINVSYAHRIKDNQIFFHNIPKNTLITVEISSENETE